MKLTILHTNDIHSNFDTLPKIATILKEQSTPYTLKLDAGDFADNCNYLIAAEDGKYGGSLISYLEYDAAAIGNNEYLLKTTNLYKESTTPYICCNLTTLDNTPIQHTIPSIIKTINSIRFLIIGNTVNGIDSYNQVLALYNKKAHSLIECIKKEITNNKDKYDIAILLSHASYEEDIEIANSIPELQVIIGGHTHLLMDRYEKHNNAYLHISGQWGSYVGKLTLDIDEHKKVITSCSSEQIPTDKVSDNIETKKYLEQLQKHALEQLKTPILILNRTLTYSLTEENSISNVLADALYAQYDCDLGIINSGILSCGLKEGPISEYDLLNCIPSPMNPSFVIIKGKAIQEAYQLSLDKEHVTQSGKAPGYRGKHIGVLSFSYNVEIKDFIIYINNQKLEENKDYRVMTSGYLQKGYGYPSLASTNEVDPKKILIRDLFKNYLKQQNKG